MYVPFERRAVVVEKLQNRTNSPAEQERVVLLWGASELRRDLASRGLASRAARGLRQLLQPKEALEARAIVIGDAALRDLPVAEVITDLRRVWPLVDIVLWCRRASASLVREALRAGARDVLITPLVETAARGVSEVIDSQQLLPRAVREGDKAALPSTFERMVSRSPKMWDVFDLATRVAHTDATVLLIGETGTGKELLARAIHRRSKRTGRFVAVNCGAVQDSLIDSELFGHTKGSFTGAHNDKPGLFRHAEKGTLMLDEIVTLPLAAQHRLLRAVQEGAVRPVGGHSEEPVDVRLIAAASTSLEDDVQRGRFREDLFYRLDVIRLEIPPLRERREDIIYLFGHFAREVAAQYNIARPDVSDAFLDTLIEYAWPGNVRQLENFTERLVLTQTGRRVTSSHLRKLLPFRQARTPGTRRRWSTEEPEAPVIAADKTLEEALGPQVDALERAYLEACLAATKGRITEAAERAGISRRTLLRKLKRHRIDKRRFRKSAPE